MSTILALLGLPSAPRAHAVAATPGVTALPGSFAGMVVDAAHSHVIVSLSTANEVRVFGYSGNLVKTITGVSGAGGVAIAAGHLYVVLDTGSIQEIALDTLTKTRTLGGGSLGGAWEIVAAAGALWVVTAATLNRELTRVDLDDGGTTPYDNPLDYYGTGLVADPSDPNTILEYEPSISPVTFARVALDADPPTVEANEGLYLPVGVSNVNDAAVTPDGTHLIPAGGSPYQFQEVNTTDLAESGFKYDANPYPTAVAITSAGGGLLAGGLSGYYNDMDLRVYRLGQHVPFFSVRFDNALVAPHGLAWQPDGSHLFVVTRNQSDFQSVSFRVVAMPGPIDASPKSITFGKQPIGTYGAGHKITFTNTTNSAISLNALQFSGANKSDFFGTTDCGPLPKSIHAGGACHATIYFAPTKLDARHADVVANFTGGSLSVPVSGTGVEGYIIAGRAGEIGPFGYTGYYGGITHPLAAPIVQITTTPNGGGYWLLGRDGGIFTFGNAGFHGSTGAKRLNKPIVAMARTPDGRGYWLVGADGGIFTFGNAGYHGSMGGKHLNKPIVGMASTPNGKGYWLVASDGGIFTFGNAGYHGSAAGHPLSAPATRIVGTPSGKGYWILTADGHVYAFGDAPNFGGKVGQPIVGMAPTPDGKGYWLAARTGGIWAFGNARWYGDLAGIGINDVADIAQSAPPLDPERLARPALASGWQPIAGGGSPPPVARASRDQTQSQPASR